MAKAKRVRKKADFRTFVEWRRKGKLAIRSEFIPSLAAYLLMLGQVYDRTVNGMREKLAVETVVGLKENIERTLICQRHLQLLLDNLTNHFGREDWLAAVAEVCRLLGLTPDAETLTTDADAVISHTFTEEGDGS